MIFPHFLSAFFKTSVVWSAELSARNHWQHWHRYQTLKNIQIIMLSDKKFLYLYLITAISFNNDKKNMIYFDKTVKCKFKCVLISCLWLCLLLLFLRLLLPSKVTHLFPPSGQVAQMLDSHAFEAEHVSPFPSSVTDGFAVKSMKIKCISSLYFLRVSLCGHITCELNIKSGLKINTRKMERNGYRSN